MNNLYLFTGMNKFAIDDKIKQIIASENVDDLSLVKYDCEETTMDEILADCETLPFLSDKKIVIINSPLFLTTEKSYIEHNLERLSAYIDNPNPTTILIFNAAELKLDKKRKLYKALAANATVLNYDNMTEIEADNFIAAFFSQRNITISHEAKSELIKRCECDSLKINSELNKLCFYLTDKKAVTLKDIEQLVCEVLENNIFNLINSLLDRKTSQAIKTYHQLLMQNEEPIVFSSILGKSFHNLYIIKQYQKQFFNEAQIRNKLKIHPYQLKILYKLAQKTKEQELIKNIHAMHEYDIQVKSGKIDKYLGFEMLILNM